MKRAGTYSRREILGYLAGTATLGAGPWFRSREDPRLLGGAPCGEPVLTYLKEMALRTPDSVDALLLGKPAGYIPRKYEPELGYLFTNGRVRHGVNRSECTYTYGPDGARLMIAHSGEPCRIASYGDSFTHGDQVNDGETWQEQLAARIGEPVRNFGVGGYSVYQAYLRLRREEERRPSRYLIFNIYDDDHRRSLDPLMLRVWAPRPSLVVEAERNGWREVPNPCPTPQSLYRLCEIDWLTEQFCNNRYIRQAAEGRARLKVAVPPRDFPGIPSRDGDEHPFMPDALYGTMRVLEAVEALASRAGSKVIHVLTYSQYRLQRYLISGYRFDEPVVQFYKSKQLPFVDMLAVHAADFARFKGTPTEYIDQYYVGGHYNPAGNDFLAAALTSQLVSVLDPKPPAYRSPA
jgi:hypothetical protein